MDLHSHFVGEGDAVSDLQEESTQKISEQLVEMFEGDCPETEFDTGKGFFDRTTPDELQGLIKQIESVVKAAKEHIKIHMTQRDKLQTCIRKAMQDLLAKVPIKLMTMVFTVDMSQYDTVSSCGVDQCGDFC